MKVPKLPSSNSVLRIRPATFTDSPIGTPLKSANGSKPISLTQANAEHLRLAQQALADEFRAMQDHQAFGKLTLTVSFEEGKAQRDVLVIPERRFRFARADGMG